MKHLALVILLVIVQAGSAWSQRRSDPTMSANHVPVWTASNGEYYVPGGAKTVHTTDPAGWTRTAARTERLQVLSLVDQHKVCKTASGNAFFRWATDQANQCQPTERSRIGFFSLQVLRLLVAHRGTAPC